jgi:osmoprotectant transport system ATP-binding protein
MIEFKGVSKTYAGSDRPVVNDLTFNIEDGEICVLVGPSGCGKTTSMRMVNRLIEPTAGEILIDGQKNTSMSGTQLRRKIGYAIQQIGLFPHRTIGQNVGTVPGLVGWDKERSAPTGAWTSCSTSSASARPVPQPLPGRALRRPAAAGRGGAGPGGGPPDHAHGRAVRGGRPDHPRQAPAGVPPHPGGHKEDHRLRHPRHRRGHKDGRQDRHPARGGILAQYDTPENILANPASDFVSSFVGTDRVLKRLSLLQVKDMTSTP